MVFDKVADWDFTDTVPVDRADKLRAWGRFEDIVAKLINAPVTDFWWEPATINPVLKAKGCHRASFTVETTPSIYDAFFNSPAGYRAQFAIGRGEKANRYLLDAWEPILLGSTAKQSDTTQDRIMASLRGIDAKVWIDEDEVDDQWSDGEAAISYPPYEFNEPHGQALQAPLGQRIQVKGGWLDEAGDEHRNPAKRDRSYKLGKTGTV